MHGTFEQTPAALAERLLQHLKPLVSTQAGGGPVTHAYGPQLFSYCCFETERLALVISDKPRIGIVLSGEKEFWLGGAGQRLTAGDVFVLPAGPEFDVVNIPAEANGLYEALLVEVDQVPKSVLEMAGPARRPATGLDLKVPLSIELVDALAHAAISLAASGHAKALAEHRLVEVLILLRTVPAAACLYEMPLPDRIAWLVLGEPSRRWTADAIGREIGMGASTLRRRLTTAGTSLREVLATARMRHAHEILASGEGNVTEAANAAGYASRSHFVRQFRSIYGARPNEIRQARH